MMKEGDLCYIPQAVRLFNQGGPYVKTTERPLIGIFIKETDAHHSAVFTQGEQRWVKTKHIYPMEVQC
tara:strand:- start:2512 stop:2715 length:204 start_codon:yes stop_codon:yes gene_type:complete